MKKVSWINNIKPVDNNLPLILTVSPGGYPIGWVNYEKSADYIVKNKVLWGTGREEIVLRGGINDTTRTRSTLLINTIMAIKNSRPPVHYKNYNPIITNKTLFLRDRNVCAYCGVRHQNARYLTRDHIIPRSLGGTDIWENIVTCCKRCNMLKGNKTLTSAGMKLLYVPYIPSLHEHLILKNRNILADQMQYLLTWLPKCSRLIQ